VFTHLTFLKRVSEDANSFNPTALSAQVRLYKHLLPLVAKHGSQNVWIPEAALWVFHCHVLHPVQYMRDCRDNFGFMVLHNPFAFKNNQEQTNTWFKEMYGQTIEQVLSSESSQGLKTNMDLVNACMTQKVFTTECANMWDVNIETELQNYQKFIKAIKVMIDQSEALAAELVPTREIDLIWHTHMRYPQEYMHFVKEETGYLLNHEDQVPDLKEQFKFTQQVWEQLYNEPYEMIHKKATCCCNAVDNEKAETVLAVMDEPIPVQLEMTILSEITCNA